MKDKQLFPFFDMAYQVCLSKTCEERLHFQARRVFECTTSSVQHILFAHPRLFMHKIQDAVPSSMQAAQQGVDCMSASASI